VAELVGCRHFVVAILVDARGWASLRRVAAESGSEALAADAPHFSSDLVNSALILVAFALVARGYRQAVALVAIGVSLSIATASFRLLRHSIDNLTDVAPVDAGSGRLAMSPPCLRMSTLSSRC
jgi:divalent metal cation (Fe/Co/Zn/Cd) transporter